MLSTSDEWHVAVLQRKRRIIQQRFNLARDAKVEVVDALNAENVPSEETLVNKHKPNLLQMSCSLAWAVRILGLGPA